MRLIGGIVLILLGLLWLASEIPLAAPPQKRPQTDWRRTCDGWEKKSWWVPEKPNHQPTLHPVVVGLLEVFLSLAVLIAFSNTAPQRPDRRQDPACR